MSTPQKSSPPSHSPPSLIRGLTAGVWGWWYKNNSKFYGAGGPVSCRQRRRWGWGFCRRLPTPPPPLPYPPVRVPGVLMFPSWCTPMLQQGRRVMRAWRVWWGGTRPRSPLPLPHPSFWTPTRAPLLLFSLSFTPSPVFPLPHWPDCFDWGQGSPYCPYPEKALPLSSPARPPLPLPPPPLPPPLPYP